MKTLGHIAYEACVLSSGGTWSTWEMLEHKEAYEAAAQAVREAVIEECAKWLESQDTYIEDDPGGAYAYSIRALKDKK